MALAATAALAATTSDAGAGIASSFGLRISDLELRKQLIEERDAGNRHAALALDSDAGRRLLQLEDILADSPASGTYQPIRVYVGLHAIDISSATVMACCPSATSSSPNCDHRLRPHSVQW